MISTGQYSTHLGQALTHPQNKPRN